MDMDRANSYSDFEEEPGSRRSDSLSVSLHSAINNARRYIQKVLTDRGRQSRINSLHSFHVTRAQTHISSGVVLKNEGFSSGGWFQYACNYPIFFVFLPREFWTLCKLGLGSKWFTNDDRLVVNLDTSAEEFHFLLTCLFPPIRGVPYEICKVTGPGNCVVVPLAINDDNMHTNSTENPSI